MANNCQRLATFFSATLILFSTSLCESRAITSQTGSSGSSQANERERGIELYEQGDTIGAIQALQSFLKQQRNDVRAWHYLGLALSRNGESDDARKAFEKAAKIGSQLLESQLDKLSSPSEIYERVNPLRTVLGEAADSAEKYLDLTPKLSRSKSSEWRVRAALLRSFEELSDELRDDHIFNPKDVTTNARIFSKPFPMYTDEALKNQISGTVVLLLTLSADGVARVLIPMSRLPYGLTETSIAAARQIKFSPATIDGKPVSVFIRIEYNFHI